MLVLMCLLMYHLNERQKGILNYLNSLKRESTTKKNIDRIIRQLRG